MLRVKYIAPPVRGRVIGEQTNAALYHKRTQLKFVPKQIYDSTIPLDVYTCWHTRDLPPLMQANFEKLIAENPELKFHLCDEDECRDFIKRYFKPDVLWAYDSLVPCSYKSDLWRYCVLFINGGIYMDIKFRCVNNFKLVSLTEREHFIRDLESSGGGTLTGLIVSKPYNNILFSCIRQIVSHVKNRFYGRDALCPTGPNLLGAFFSEVQKRQMEMYFADATINGERKLYIGYNDGAIDRAILQMYDEYRAEQALYQKKAYYADLWHKGAIYK